MIVSLFIIAAAYFILGAPGGTLVLLCALLGSIGTKPRTAAVFCGLALWVCAIPQLVAGDTELVAIVIGIPIGIILLFARKLPVDVS